MKRVSFFLSHLHCNTRLFAQRSARLSFNLLWLVGTTWLLSLGSAQAQWVQGTPIKILVGAPAGGTTDTTARILAQALALQLSKNVVVENRPGAGGNLAAELVAKAPADGNTLLMCFTSHAINASLYPSLSFDPVKDFTPLTLVASSPSVLVASPSLVSLGIHNTDELLGYAKAHPGKLNFAIGALGSSLHMAGEEFKMRGKVYIVNIPYKGTAPAVQDLLAGQVDLMFAALGNVQQHIKSGKLTALGVTSLKPLSALPSVAPIAQSLPGFESTAWFGLLGPAGMSPQLQRELSQAARQALGLAQTREKIEMEGATVVASTSAEFSRFLSSEVVRWGKVVAYSGAKPE
jgi:tripartite-type tricarboxylate transporter receptor subunit TctC